MKIIFNGIVFWLAFTSVFLVNMGVEARHRGHHNIGNNNPAMVYFQGVVNLGRPMRPTIGNFPITMEEMEGWPINDEMDMTSFVGAILFTLALVQWLGVVDIRRTLVLGSIAEHIRRHIRPTKHSVQAMAKLVYVVIRDFTYHMSQDDIRAYFANSPILVQNQDAIIQFRDDVRDNGVNATAPFPNGFGGNPFTGPLPANVDQIRQGLNASNAGEDDTGFLERGLIGRVADMLAADDDSSESSGDEGEEAEAANNGDNINEQ